MAGGDSTTRHCSGEVLPFAVMVAMECANVGLTTLFKLATLHGMSPYVFLVYAYAVGAIILLPSPFFALRSPVLPALNFGILLKIFLLAVVGFVSQMMGYIGINYASPTLASAMGTLAPAFTFVLAIIFRMEKMELSSRSCQAKVFGTVVSIAGALVITFYKGPTLSTAAMAPVSLNKWSHSSESSWITGSLFITVEYSLVPVWYIVQTQIMKQYPTELTVVFFYATFVCILAAIVGFFTEKDLSKWRIRSDVALASMLCSGVFASCLNNVIHTWALHLRGPVYVAMFKPLSIAIAAAMGVVILGDTLHLGCVIGATIIVTGFYTVIWGKAKEELAGFEDRTGDLDPSMAPTHPLLETYTA